ncbi:MAG TPA: glycosyltransferase [Frankiaceae bacterium]|nr:glycosyltransferase [Frankiaceae bacterium]
MDGKYQFNYTDASVYGHVVHLVRSHARPGGIVVDLGAGFGAIAEPCHAAGYGYIGFDVDPEGLDDLKARGFESARIDLDQPDDAVAAIDAALGDRPLAAITMLDTVEHLTRGPETLAALSELALRRGGAPLVVSIPNVTHIDLAAKLLLGRWDVTDTGLLDRTHVRFYDSRDIVEVPAAAGWHQVGADDFELVVSDQHFPEGLAVLSRKTPIGRLLADIRAAAAPSMLVNQYVRAYVPGKPVAAPSAPVDEPFATILVRTQGRRPETLHDALLSLAAQTCEDHEVLLLCHNTSDSQLRVVSDVVASFPPEFRERVRVVPVSGGRRGTPLNAGVAEARGRYVTILDDDDVVTAHWVEEFKRAADEAPGSIVRAVVARQDFVAGERGRMYEPIGPASCPYPDEFDFLGHLVDNWSPLCGFAFPRICFSEFGVRFDDELTVLEDWDVVVTMAPLCGVVSTKEPTSVYRRWLVGSHSGVDHSDAEWEAARTLIRERLNDRPVLMPPGAVARVRHLFASHDHQKERADKFEREANFLRERLHHVGAEYRNSTSWRITAPLRLFGKVARKLRAIQRARG